MRLPLSSEGTTEEVAVVEATNGTAAVVEEATNGDAAIKEATNGDAAPVVEEEVKEATNGEAKNGDSNGHATNGNAAVKNGDSNGHAANGEEAKEATKRKADESGDAPETVEVSAEKIAKLKEAVEEKEEVAPVVPEEEIAA